MEAIWPQSVFDSDTLEHNFRYRGDFSAFCGCRTHREKSQSMGDGASGCVRRRVWPSSTRRSRLIRSTEVPWDDIQVQDQYRYGFAALDGVGSRSGGSTRRQIGQTCWWKFRGGKLSLLVLSVTTEESRFYVSFRIRAALRMQLIVTLKSLFICIRLWLKCPHSCSCSSSPEKEFFFFLSFWKVKHPASSRASFFTPQMWVSAQVWGITATTSSQFAPS